MIAVQVGKPSTLIDVIAQVRDVFQAIGNPTPIMVGANYEKHAGPGSAARVVFIPERGAGKIDQRIVLGNAARMVHSCDVLVRSDATGDDVTRFRAAYELADLVIDCVQTAGSGRVVWGSLRDDSPDDVDAYGAGLRFSFTFERDVRHDASRWRLPEATPSTATPYAATPDNRDGAGAQPTIVGTVGSINPTATPEATP